jgi:protein TonB
MVIVGLTVDKSGNATDVHLLQGVGNDLDKEALKAVQQYHFTPASYRGKPVASEIKVEVNFKIY